MDTLFFQPQIEQGIRFLTPEESKHCAKVLRKKEGELISVTDGKGTLYNSIITDSNSQCVKFKIESSVKEKDKGYTIHVAIAPTKNPDRIEWFVEKAIEIGVDEISLILCDKSERAALKTDRLDKLAVSAMKQSLKTTLTKINHMMLFKDFISSFQAAQKFIAHVDSANPVQLKDSAKSKESYIVLIGPEGDFSKKEIDLAISHDYKKVGLGPNRLRTETAGIVACTILNLANQ
jgi:16S rRNA (uracil1498-N3)-methyltransferase